MYDNLPYLFLYCQVSLSIRVLLQNTPGYEYSTGSPSDYVGKDKGRRDSTALVSNSLTRSDWYICARASFSFEHVRIPFRVSYSLVNSSPSNCEVWNQMRTLLHGTWAQPSCLVRGLIYGTTICDICTSFCWRPLELEGIGMALL